MYKQICPDSKMRPKRCGRDNKDERRYESIKKERPRVE